MKKLLLFDIDGTLLVTAGAGVAAMQSAGKRVFGDAFDMSQLVFGGGLDPILLQSALEPLGAELTPSLHETFKKTYGEELERRLAEPLGKAEALPGVHQLLASLQESGRAILGVLTGNYEHTGKQKLEWAQIEPNLFEVQIWGDHAPTRPGLVRRALSVAGVLPQATMVIGDTPRDVHCAKANTCYSLAVATGLSDMETLSAAGADTVLPSLVDATAIWRWLDAP